MNYQGQSSWGYNQQNNSSQGGYSDYPSYSGSTSTNGPQQQQQQRGYASGGGSATNGAAYGSGQQSSGRTGSSGSSQRQTNSNSYHSSLLNTALNSSSYNNNSAYSPSSSANPTPTTASTAQRGSTGSSSGNYTAPAGYTNSTTQQQPQSQSQRTHASASPATTAAQPAAKKARGPAKGKKTSTAPTTLPASQRPATVPTQTHPSASPITPTTTVTSVQASQPQAQPQPPQPPAEPQPTLTHMLSRIELLIRSQSDLIQYLHAELDRRREWESAMTDDMHSRHTTILTLISGLAPVGGSLKQDIATLLKGMDHPRPPPPPIPVAAQSQPVTVGGGMPRSQQQHLMSILQDVLDSGGLGNLGAAAAAVAASGGEAGPSSARTRDTPRLANNSFNGSPASQLRKVLQQSSALTGSPLNGGGGAIKRSYEDMDDSMAGDQSFDMGHGGDGDDGPGGGGLGENGEEVVVDGVEVDSRGVVYMASNRGHGGTVASKIPSVVRKTIYAAMGLGQGKHTIPIFKPGDKPHGSAEWKFGNLRFDWEKTSKRSTHNALMKKIVLEHIASLRNEYSTIPDSDFQPARLDLVYDQAFTTWRMKYLNKKQGRKADSAELGSHRLGSGGDMSMDMGGTYDPEE